MADLPHFRKIDFYFVFILHFLIVFLILFSTFHRLADIDLKDLNWDELFEGPSLRTSPLQSSCNIRYPDHFPMLLRRSEERRVGKESAAEVRRASSSEAVRITS